MTATLTPETFKDLYKPYHPFASMDPRGEGVERMHRTKALNTMRHIEINAHQARNLIAVDADSFFALAAVRQQVEEGALPMFTTATVNTAKDTFHAHMTWAIDGFVKFPAKDEPTPRKDESYADYKARVTAWEHAIANPTKAQRFYNAVREGITEVVDGGDKSFTHYTMRNPLLDGETWEQAVMWGTDHRYTMTELAAYIEDKRPRKAALPLFTTERTGGRNTDGFNALRTFGYRAFVNAQTRDDFWIALHERANEINMSFGSSAKGKLPSAEMGKIERSVGQWIERHFTKDAFGRIQTARANRRWLTTEEAQQAQRNRIEVLGNLAKDADTDTAVELTAKQARLQRNLDAAQARAALTAEITAYIQAGEKTGAIYAAVGEAHGLTYAALAQRVAKIRKDLKATGGAA